MAAVIPTLLAVAAGIVLGLRGGGRPTRLLRWRPVLWEAAAVALVIQVAFRVLPISGGFAVVLDLVAVAAALAFALANLRVPGMVVIVAALVLHAVPVIVNWGMPVRPGALVSAGLVEEDELDAVELEGPRHLADDGDRLGFLSETIPLPTGQVLSLADVVGLVGVALVISALMRGRRIGGSLPTAPRRRPAGPRTRRPAPPPPVRRRPARRDAFEVRDPAIDLRDRPVRRR